MSEKNPDLVALHESLGEVVDALVLRQEAATDPVLIQALGAEIREVLFRVTGVQRRLFKAQTAEIAKAVADVAAARDDVDRAIAEIEDLNQFIRTVSGFLGLVDKAIDAAKLL